MENDSRKRGDKAAVKRFLEAMNLLPITAQYDIWGLILMRVDSHVVSDVVVKWAKQTKKENDRLLVGMEEYYADEDKKATQPNVRRRPQ